MMERREKLNTKNNQRIGFYLVRFLYSLAAQISRERRRNAWKQK